MSAMAITIESDQSVPDLYHQAVRAMYVGLAVNTMLAVVKVIAGIMSHSIAMIADAANSVGDSLVSCVTIYALKYAQKPADSKHPYGHSRVESVAALTVAVVIAASAAWIIIEAARNFTNIHRPPPIWVLGVAGGNLIIKEAVYWYKRSVWKRTGSQVVLANAWDHRSDALCSAAVLIGLLLLRYGGPGMISADEVAAIVVGGFILYTSGRLYFNTASSLMDEQSDSTLIESITEHAVATQGVVAVEQLRARKSGLEVLVDIHIEVRGDRTVDDGHRIAHDVQRAILSNVTNVTQVLVHIEPANDGR